VTVLRPHTNEIASTDNELVRLAGDPADPEGIEKAQIEAIIASTLLYVVNPGGYVGLSTIGQCGFAAGRGIAVICSEPPSERFLRRICTGYGTPQEALILLILNEQEQAE
jgi:hypothetical protein